MSIKVTNFKWEKGKNDLEYIELLENNLDVMLDKFRECSKVAREQYNKGYTKGRADAFKLIKENWEQLKSAYRMNGHNLNTDIWLDDFLTEQLTEQNNEKC